MTEKTRKVKPRWKKGGERYSKDEQAQLSKRHEQPGWRNGAKVRKR